MIYILYISYKKNKLLKKISIVEVVRLYSKNPNVMILLVDNYINEYKKIYGASIESSLPRIIKFAISDKENIRKWNYVITKLSNLL